MERIVQQLSFAQMIELMKAAKEAGVSRVVITQEKFEFELQAPGPRHSAAGQPEPHLEPTSTAIVYPEVDQETLKKHQQEIDDQLAKLREERRIEQIKIEDPLLYEEMLARGEIEDVQDEHGDATAGPQPA